VSSGMPQLFCRPHPQRSPLWRHPVISSVREATPPSSTSQCGGLGRPSSTAREWNLIWTRNLFAAQGDGSRRNGMIARSNVRAGRRVDSSGGADREMN
jgi:hypothetical protein